MLLEFAKGKNPKDFLLESAFSSLKDITNDKKYSSKLLHKWKKELYLNKNILSILSHHIDNQMIDYEIENIDSSAFLNQQENILEQNFNDDFVKIINKN
jgi:hypothetical protein